MTRARIILAVSLLACVTIGLGAGWWLGSPPPPWLVFKELHASYRLGSNEILLTGRHLVNRECASPVSWYQEALATDGQIAQYGPVSGAPLLTKGMHLYEDKIALTEEIFPDGWKVWLIARCESETVTSMSARVVITK